jgi:hypothetical protein
MRTKYTGGLAEVAYMRHYVNPGEPKLICCFENLFHRCREYNIKKQTKDKV